MRTTGIVLVVAAALTTSCGGSAECAGFSASLAVDRGGAPSPVAAAETYGSTGEGPGSGWREDGRDGSGAVLRSGAWTLHAVQMSDGTWFVDSGRSC